MPNPTDAGAAAAASSVEESVPSATEESPASAPAPSPAPSPVAPALPPAALPAESSVAHPTQSDSAPVPLSKPKMESSHGQHVDDHGEMLSAADELPAAAAGSALDEPSPHEDLHLHFEPQNSMREEEEDIESAPNRRTTRAAAAAAAPPALIALNATAAPAVVASVAASVQRQRSTAKAAAARPKNKRSHTDSSDSESDASSSSMDGSSSSSDESSAPDSTPPRRRATGRAQAIKKPMLVVPDVELKLVAPFDVEAFRSQTERVEDGYSFSLPLADEFPFETGQLATLPLVVALSQHQAVVITPAANHTEQLQLDPSMLIPSTFKEASCMTLGCGNNNGVMVTPRSLAEEKKFGLWLPVPTERAVSDFIDEDWRALQAGQPPPRVPDLMSNRQYSKDQSERFDFGGESRKQRPFFPKQQEQLQELLQKLPPEPAASSLWGSKKEFTRRRRWLRDLFQRLVDLRAEQKQKSFCPESFVHPLFLNELQLHRQSLINLSPVEFEGVSSYYLYLKVGFQFFNLVRQTTSKRTHGPARMRTLHLSIRRLLSVHGVRAPV